MSLQLPIYKKPALGGLDLFEFQRSTLIWLVLLEGTASVFWQIFENQQLILLLTFCLHTLAFWLIFKSLPLAGLVWVIAVASVVTATVGIYEMPLVTGILSLLPLFITMLYGLKAGFLTQGLIILLMLLLSDLFKGTPEIQPFVVPVSMGGIAALFLGTIFRFSFLQSLQVYYTHYRWASQGIDEAREQRLELTHIQEDLQHANRELARLASQLKIANQTAEEARRAKETFVATVSHELRTPLNMIIGFSEVITQSPRVYGTRLPPTLLADIASIQRNSQHLLELVNDVLDLSQVDMGNLSITRSRCSLHELVGEAFDVIRPLFNSKGLYLEAEYGEEDSIIYCDQTRIREVIINLLSNAGRFTEQGGVNLRASVENGILNVAVRDTGPGISNENQPKLFEPFQQLDNSIRRKHGGSGLGLAISKGFVEMHGGQMGLQSQLGEGTTFFFNLPIEPPEMEMADMMDAPTSQSAVRWINPHAMVDARQRPFMAPASVLVPRCVVLESGDIARRLFERYLGQMEVVSVQDVESAVRYLSESPAQLLVINHPKAPVLLEQLTVEGRLPFGLPIITFWLPGSADMADALNVTSYLIKPVTKNGLLKALEAVVGSQSTVLLVDDNPEVLQLFGRILSTADMKFQVLRASDGQQGLDMLRKRKPDVIILDLVMPILDGFQFLQEKAADPEICDIPVILVSAQDPAGVQRISKPVALTRVGGYSPRQLLELVRISGALPDLDDTAS